ncbi:MAG: hypothetical protein M3Y20_03150, partial [Actinomycetota bacterium]|nr:hypothetical protein [Actinomycetota bacterium]
MSYRARALRIVALVAVVAVVGVGVLMLSRGPDPAGVVTTPVAGPTPTPRPTSSPTTAEAIEPPAPESVTVPVDDPASVFVEEDFAELPPVGLDEPADYGNDVTVTLDELERVDGEAAGPGEVAGPAVLVSITLHNASD